MAWQLNPNMTREVAQTLQEARKAARSIENTTASLAPLVTELSEEATRLDSITTKARQIAAELSGLYNGIALKAFGPESPR